MTDNSASRERKICALMDRWSIEITAKDAERFEAAADILPPGTKVPVTFLPGEEFEMRVATARRVKELGFVPIPHISARRLHSEEELRGFLGALQREVGNDHAFVVAGDPAEPMGPYADALAIIQSGLLAPHGIKRVGISGYPEGHSDIGNDKIWQAMHDKRDELLKVGHDFAIVTQFGFDAVPMLKWVEEVRAAGIDATIRLGVPGPASVKRLLAFAARCGVLASASVLRKYGLSVTKLLSSAGPDRLIEALADGYDPIRHGDVKIHFYPFGGIRPTVEWANAFQARHGC